MKEYTLFIGCLYYLPVHCHSCCFYIQNHGDIREMTSMPVYKYFVLYYVLYYQDDEETLDSFILRSYLRYKKGPDLNLPPPASPLFVATSLTPV